MLHAKAFVSTLLAVSCIVAVAKEKKSTLPPAVLEAKTVLVVIDPQAGMAVDDPEANSNAQRDVERALAGWGRLGMATDVSTADLVIVVRKGSGKLGRPTIGGIPNNRRPDVMQPSEDSVRIGGRRGTPPMEGDPTAAQPVSPQPKMEVGAVDDSFLVYLGRRNSVLDAPTVWRYTAKDGLRSPGVPAVDAFKKAIEEAEKKKP